MGQRRVYDKGGDKMKKSDMAKAVDKEIKKSNKATNKKGLISGVDSDYQWKLKGTDWSKKCGGFE
jgi:hypothetical protein